MQAQLTTGREWVLWGTPSGETDPLYEKVLTCTPDRQRVETVKRLAGAEGWHSFRIQILDGSRPDFAATVR